MIYEFQCPKCDTVQEIISTMDDVSGLFVMCDCGMQMKRKYGFRVSAGRKQRYARSIISDSLAINPEQIPEHRKLFPNIEVTPEGQPVFDNFTDHQAYLDKCNIQKLPQRKRMSGKKI